MLNKFTDIAPHILKYAKDLCRDKNSFFWDVYLLKEGSTDGSS